MKPSHIRLSRAVAFSVAVVPVQITHASVQSASASKTNAVESQVLQLKPLPQVFAIPADQERNRNHGKGDEAQEAISPACPERGIHLQTAKRQAGSSDGADYRVCG